MCSISCEYNGSVTLNPIFSGQSQTWPGTLECITAQKLLNYNIPENRLTDLFTLYDYSYDAAEG